MKVNRTTRLALAACLLTGLALLSGGARGQFFLGDYTGCLDRDDQGQITGLSNDYAAQFVDNGVVAFDIGWAGTVTWRCFDPKLSVPAAGRFSLGTIRGSERDPNDNNVALTWSYPYSSGYFGYSTIQVADAQNLNPERAIWGANGFILAPELTASGKGVLGYIVGPKNTRVWLRIEVIQDTWKFSYWFENGNDTPVVVQVRWAQLLQMLISTEFPAGPTIQDPTLVLPVGELPWTVDRIFFNIGSVREIPDVLEFYKNNTLPNPSLRLYMTPDLQHPDQAPIERVSVGTWVRTIEGAEHIWDSELRPDSAFKGTGFAMITQPVTLAANWHWNNGAGLGNPMTYQPDVVIYASLAAGQSDISDPVALGTEAPKSLSFTTAEDENSANGLTPNPFTIVAKVTDLYRTAGQQQTLNNVLVTLDLPEGLEYLSPRQQLIPTIAPNETQTVSWTVRATGTRTGVVNYSVFASPQDLPTKQVQNSIVISASVRVSIGPGVTNTIHKDNYQMISLPFALNPPSATLADVLGLPSSAFTAWQLNPTTNSWVRVERASPRRGLGFFVKAPAQTVDITKQLQNVTIPPGQLTTTYTVTLPVGWNQIGTPWLYPIYWRQLQFVDTNNPQRVLSFAEAISAGLIRDQLYEWEPFRQRGSNPNILGDYVLRTESAIRLQPFKAYFVRVINSRPIQVIFPPVYIPGAGTTGGPRSPQTSGDWLFQNRDKWRLAITANATDGSQANVAFGVAADARDGSDPRDLAIPPTLATTGVRVAFEHKDWTPQVNGLYSQDVRSSRLGRHTFNMVVTTNGGRDVTLKWPSLERFMSDYSIKLLDVQTNQYRDLRLSSSYRYYSSGTRRFQVILERLR